MNRVILLCGLLLSAAASAEWSGNVSVGLIANSGNTDSTDANAKFNVSKQSGDWEYLAKAAVHLAEKDDTATQEEYLLRLKANYRLNSVSYLFGVLGFQSDRFAGYRRRYTQSVGYGHELIKTERHQLRGEVGAGLRQSRLVTGERQEDWIGQLNLEYVYQFAEKSTFEQTLQVITGPDNTTTLSDTSLKMPLVNNFGIRLGYEVEHNTDVAADAEKTDTKTSINLEYTF